MIALFGESLASCTDITGCADAPPRGFHASVYGSDQGEGRGRHDSIFQVVSSNRLREGGFGGLCVVHRGPGQSTTPRICAAYALPRRPLHRLVSMTILCSVFPTLLHHRFDGAL